MADNATLADQIFVGGSEMARRMRAHDWSKTAIGPLDRWPQSLRTAVSICLASRFPMLLWWGPTLSVLYNDAYIPIFARKHPWVLGRPGTDAWGEVWDVIGPMFERVMGRGEATWSDDQLLELFRRGFLEETYLTWSYSPIRDESGGVGGVFTAVIETTERVLSARRLLTLRELGEQAFRATSVERASCLAVSTLAKNREDLPFAVLYTLDAAGGVARRIEVTGLPEGHPAAPAAIRLDAAGTWPIGDVQRSGTAATVDVLSGFGPIVAGRWPEPTTRAQLLPLVGASEEVVGVLVAGLSPRLEFDDAYRGFLDLVARHISQAIATAAAYEEERRRAEALAELDRAKTVFFSNVSHEFRTPLTLMLGPTEEALRGPDPALRGEDLQVVHRNELRLLKLVNTLLDFSRIEAGRIDARYERTDLGAVTADLASVFRSAAERGGLALDVRVPDEPVEAWVDRDMWEKIVLNLLSNALKHTFTGSIAVDVRRVGDQVEVRVADTGVGIPDEHLPRIFERFHRVPAARARTQEGTGIGLALVHELVRLHHGAIDVESAVDRGTTFRVTLPAGSAHLPADRLGGRRTVASTALGATPFVEEALRWLPAAAGPVESSMQRAQPLAGTFADARYRLLVADDNSDMRDYLARLLAPVFDVETAVDGEDALARYRARPPDVVLSDIMMPRLDGFGLLSAIRADPGGARTPVVLLSARAGEEARIEGLTAGADDYLVKPFGARELVATLRAHAGLAALRREFEARERALRSEADRATAEIDRILASVGEGFVTMDSELRYVYINDAAEAMIGRPRAELLGRRPWDVFPERLIREPRRHIETALATGAVVRFEAHIPETGHWYESRVYPVGNAVSIFFSDVTARKKADEMLARSERAQRLLVSLNDATRALRNPDDVMWEIVTRVGRHFHASRCTYGEVDEAQAFVTVSRDYTDGAASIAGRHRLSNFGVAIVDELKAGRTVVIEDVRRDPRTAAPDTLAAFNALDVLAAVAVPLVKEGRFAAVLVLHAREPRGWAEEEVALLEQIAERTWFAVENARAEAALRESRDVLSLAMRGGRMGAWSRNLVTNAVWWSHDLEEIAGLPPGGFKGTESGFFEIVHEDDRAAVERAVSAALASGTDYIVEFRFRHGNGDWRWMEGRGRATYDQSGSPTFLYGIGIDITERKRTETALEAARDAAESANRLKDQFLATLSHELRTPLNAILGYAHMLRTHAIAPEKRDRAVEIIERNAVAQNQLVEDLLDISRITTGKVRLEPERIPAAAPLREALEVVKPAAEAKDITLELTIDPFAGTVNADPTRLQQVFWNLLTNAVKFTGAGGTVRVGLQRVDGAIEASVSDTGVGIPPEFLPFVFDPFRQADARFAREHGGLGLGLAICRQLVELHGGTISAVSEGTGRGSTFTIRLPVRPSAAGAPEEVSAGRGPAASLLQGGSGDAPRSLAGLEILLVDDERDTLELFRDALEAAGAVVRAVSAAGEALREFDRQPPDLLVTDLGLPGMDGYELIRRIRARTDRARHVPAVAVTAYARLADRSKALGAGFQEHLAKPVDPDKLVQLVGKVASVAEAGT